MKPIRRWHIYGVIIFTLSSIVFESVAADIAALRSDDYEYGISSWYGAKYRGRKTASGERFDPSDLTAAHPTLPMGTLVEVSRPDRSRNVVVRINDRGPGGGRVLDVSEAAARKLGLLGEGTGLVSLQIVGFAD
jgi:rare lipoprotein A